MPDDQDLDSSVMDRTKKLRQARDQNKKKARQQLSAEEEAQHLEQLASDLKDKVEATRLAKARSAESRRIIDDLQSELNAEDDSSENDRDADQISKTEVGNLVADSLKSAVSIALNLPKLLITRLDRLRLLLFSSPRIGASISVPF